MSARNAGARGLPDERPTLRVVRRRSKNLIKREKTRRLAPLTITCAIAVAAIVLGVLLMQVVLGQSAFKLAGLREHMARAEARHEELLLQAAKLESPGRIERFARTTLGMIEPPQFEYIVADVGQADANVARAPGLRRGRVGSPPALTGSAVGVVP